MRFFHHKQLIKNIRDLKRSGGRFALAGDEIVKLMGRIQLGDQNPLEDMRLTKHGETRIANCVKYDLSGYARLVTVMYNNLQILLFAGTHEDTDKWLDGHKGAVFAIDSDSRITEISVSRDDASTQVRIDPKPDMHAGPIIGRLPYDDMMRLLNRLSGGEAFQLQRLMVGASSEMIRGHVDLLREESLRLPVFDVMMLLNAGDIEGAQNRLGLLDGALKPIAELSPEQILNVRDGDGTKQILIGSDDYQKWISEYIRSSSYYDWFLFMHPEQEKYVNEDYVGPAKLSGISGSGKTCIAIRRAIRLAKENPQGRIAIITLNRSLAQLIDTLVEHACADQALKQQIHITSLFALCQDLLSEFEPENGKLYDDVTWRLEEHIDEIYREYYRMAHNFHRAEVMLPLHRQLTAAVITAESYLRDEFDWLRSAFPADARAEYLDKERVGRGLPLTREQRKMVIEGLLGWESKMADIGVTDYLGLSTAVSRHIDKLKQRFSSIIIDEAQDFGTTELSILRKLVPPGQNDMFLCGDLAQHILPKHLSFREAGVDVQGRSFTIRRNYRNSREILKAAYEILYNNLNEEMFKASDLELLDPEYANRSSAAPIVLRAASVSEEIKAAIQLIRDNGDNCSKEGRGHPHRGCIAIAGHTLYEISIFGKEHDIPVLDGTAGVKEGDLFLSDLEQTKGYEFDTMVVVNCSADALPPRGVPEDEAFRFGCQLYVAMTRAKDQLVLSYSGQPSPWLRAEGVNIDFGEWAEFVDLDAGTDIGAPGYLPENIGVDDSSDDIMVLNGRDFLFTPYALGLKADVQEKIEQLVGGRNVMRGRHRVEWKDVGTLRDDLVFGRDRGRTGYIFGPAADKEVAEALERAKSGIRPVARKTWVRLPSAAPQIPVSAEELPPKREAPAVGDTGELPIKNLNLPTRTYLVLHEMKIRKIADLIELGYAGLVKNGRLSYEQIKGIDAAMNRFGKMLPEGGLKKPVPRQSQPL